MIGIGVHPCPFVVQTGRTKNPSESKTRSNRQTWFGGLVECPSNRRTVSEPAGGAIVRRMTENSITSPRHDHRAEGTNPVAEQDSILISRRQRVGWVAAACLAAATIGFASQGYENAWASAASRVGIVLAALWLCLPTKTRPAAWAAITPVKLAVIVMAALLSYRLKFFLPLLLAAGIVGWVLRPKRKRM